MSFSSQNLRELNPWADPWWNRVVMAAADEIERLSAENERLHKRTTELEKRAGTAERNLRHVTEACEELRVNANEGWRQYGLCAEQNFVLEPINARLRKALQDMQAIAIDALNPNMRVRAALAEQTGFNEPTPHKPQYPFEIKSSAAEKEKT